MVVSKSLRKGDHGSAKVKSKKADNQ